MGDTLEGIFRCDPEKLFRRNVNVLLKKRGLVFDFIIPNVPISEREFYSIVGFGANNLLVVEIKEDRLNKRDVDFFLKKRLLFLKNIILHPLILNIMCPMIMVLLPVWLRYQYQIK